MAQPDNYTPVVTTGTDAQINVVIPWTFDGVNTLAVEQTDGTTTVTKESGAFIVAVSGQTAIVENFFGDGNLTTITIRRETKLTQEFTLQEDEPLNGEGLTSELDKMVRMIQDLSGLFGEVAAQEILQKAITSDDPFVIPDNTGRQSSWLGFDENGNLYLGVPDNVDPPGAPTPGPDYLTKLAEIKTIADTSYTLLEDDKGKLLIFTSSSNVTVTSPNDLSLGWQAMFMKTETGAVISHEAASGAVHSNTDVITISKSFAWYSAIVFNQAGSAANYRFIGEIDEDIREAEGEVVDRNVLIPAGSTFTEAQDLINSIGKFLGENVKVRILFENGSYNFEQGLLIEGFNGPGQLVIEPLNTTVVDHSSRIVTVNNTNSPANTDYDILGKDTFLDWETVRLNSCIFISSCSCSAVKVRGIEFNSTVFPVALSSNSVLVDIKACHANQLNAFTLAQLPKAAGILANSTNINVNTCLVGTDQDGDAVRLEGSLARLDNTNGNGSHLVVVDYGSNAAEETGSSNSGFNETISLYQSIGGVFISAGTIQNV